MNSEPINDWCDCDRIHGWHPWTSECHTPGPVEHGSVVPITPYYSAALDEIYRLRTLLAYEAGTLAAHTEYKTFPKSRQRFAQASIARMQAASRGEIDAQLVSNLGSDLAVRSARKEAGMPDPMTRQDWETQTFRKEET